MMIIILDEKNEWIKTTNLFTNKILKSLFLFFTQMITFIFLNKIKSIYPTSITRAYY